MTTWPKKCGKCGTQYTEAEFRALASPPAGRWTETTGDEDEPLWLEFRNCPDPCGSTMCVEVPACEGCGAPEVDHEGDCPVAAQETQDRREAARDWAAEDKYDAIKCGDRDP